jgi:hypothetical protein
MHSRVYSSAIVVFVQIKNTDIIIIMSKVYVNKYIYRNMDINMNMNIDMNVNKNRNMKMNDNFYNYKI